MNIHRANKLNPVGGQETPQGQVLHRRRFLSRMRLAIGGAAVGGLGYFGWKHWQGTDSQVIQAGQPGEPLRELVANYLPVPTDERFEYGRTETEREEAARYANFYEFSNYKWVWRYVEPFRPHPWKLTIDGLCRKPLELDLDDVFRQFQPAMVERQYRHRCVETWAMAVPWLGFPLAELLKKADPLESATHVRFVSFHRPEQSPNLALKSHYPWPYTEGLTIEEAANELTLLAVGMYGEPLLKQHGAPIRLVVPWKYGYKSIKSIDRIELVDHQPATFWSTLNPPAYPFESNVDPQVSVPWSQSDEWMLGSQERYPTQLYNGYESYVGHLYGKAMWPGKC